MKTVSIGCNETPRVRISVLSYERASNGELFDYQWVASRVEISVGGFTADYKASFLARDFIDFNSQLQPLFETLNGEAIFETLEHQLQFRLLGNGRGGIEVKGKACDLHRENEFSFIFQIDQTHLPYTLKELKELISDFSARPA
jgi:hypothetical protein